MKHRYWTLLGLGLLAGTCQAQDASYPPPPNDAGYLQPPNNADNLQPPTDESYIPPATQAVGYGDTYLGPASIGSGEPLFRYSDQEKWKHGYIKNMPYYEGFHSFRPYNYHHVFSQAQTSAGWGMPATMPYSQQFWHRYEKMADLSRGDHSPVAPYIPPPDVWDHYPQPVSPGASNSTESDRTSARSGLLGPDVPNSLPPLPSSTGRPAQSASWKGIPSLPTAPLTSPY